jgi:hypothetical protein
MSAAGFWKTAAPLPRMALGLAALSGGVLADLLPADCLGGTGRQRSPAMRQRCVTPRYIAP